MFSALASSAPKLAARHRPPASVWARALHPSPPASTSTSTSGAGGASGNGGAPTPKAHKEWEAAHLSAPQRGAEMPLNVSRRQRRIIYRSKQRGWLELDILFGSWAAKHVPHMTADRDLAEIESLLDADTPDMLKWVLRQQPPPPVYDTATMRSLQAFAAGDGHVNER